MLDPIKDQCIFFFSFLSSSELSAKPVVATWAWMQRCDGGAVYSKKTSFYRTNPFSPNDKIQLGILPVMEIFQCLELVPFRLSNAWNFARMARGLKSLHFSLPPMSSSSLIRSISAL